MSRVIRFENLVDANGKTIEIEVDDDFDENSGSFAAAGKRGAAFGKRFRAGAISDARGGDFRMLSCIATLGPLSGEAGELIAKAGDLREVSCLAEVGRLGAESGEKFAKAFGKNQE